MAYQVSAKAKKDLRDIAIYTEKQWGREQKRRYMATVKESLMLLSEHPGVGHICTDIAAGYCKYHVGKHYIFYRQTASDSIEIVRILHERMNFELHFND